MIYTITLNPALDKEYHTAKLLPNTVMRSESANVDFGGKGFNIARMLKILGIECTALGFIGGQTGKILETGLEELGIKTDFVHIKEETRTNISIVGNSEAKYFKVNEPGPHVTVQEVDELQCQIEKLANAADWWILAGSLPQGIRTDIYASLIEVINRKGAKAVLDSSGEALRLGCKAKPFLIKPNLEEMEQITGVNIHDRVTLDEALAGVHGFGVSNILLSAGKDKSYFSNGTERWVGQPPKIVEGNPTGAGDAMLAVTVARLSQGAGIMEALAWGIAAGSAAASLPGTRMPTMEAIEKFKKTVVVREE